jgi:hypothetical protein
MKMKFENWMTCEILTSDGNYTIGYVDGEPAAWDGNMKQLVEGDEFTECQQHSDFNTGNETYWVIDGEWCEKES